MFLVCDEDCPYHQVEVFVDPLAGFDLCDRVIGEFYIYFTGIFLRCLL
jgi:hypothetical protein